MGAAGSAKSSPYRITRALLGDSVKSTRRDRAARSRWFTPFLVALAILIVFVVESLSR